MQRVSPIINSQRQPNLEKSEYTNGEIYSEYADGGTGTRNPSVINRVL